MLKFDRHAVILNELSENGSVSLSGLMSKISRPRLTIQRDLVELEKTGKLKRVHGGAVLLNQDFVLKGIPKIIREKENIDVKRKLAKKAAELISEKDVVCIDGSTTCGQMAQFIPDVPINIVTPSIELFLALGGKKNLIPVLPGGMLSKNTQDLVGNFTSDIIARFSYSLCFISADGFDFRRGSLELNYEQSAVKKTMIENSKKIILLIDSTKLENNKGVLTCKNKDIYKIITDSSPKKWADNLRNKLMLV
ncbi:MAG: DeoR/GlpR family DNA-binding transcription regulator [Elusimicrobia bacterium]|nr:DeoR/GlpR family DNA-binding transcription regulator [Elusimicrobiota bacterium]